MTMTGDKKMNLKERRRRVERQPPAYLDIPCWYFSIRPSYLPSAMSWTSWSARLSWISSLVSVCFDPI